MDEIEHDNAQISLTDKILADKFAPLDDPVPPPVATTNMTPAQAKMAKARAARTFGKKGLTEKSEGATMSISEERRLYADSLLTMIKIRSPKSAVELELCKTLAADLVKHVKDKYGA